MVIHEKFPVLVEVITRLSLYSIHIMEDLNPVVEKKFDSKISHDKDQPTTSITKIGRFFNDFGNNNDRSTTISAFRPYLKILDNPFPSTPGRWSSTIFPAFRFSDHRTSSTIFGAQNSTVSSSSVNGDENAALDLSIHNRRRATVIPSECKVNRCDSQDAPIIDQYSPSMEYDDEHEDLESSLIDVLNDDSSENDVSNKFDFRRLAETIDGQVSKSTNQNGAHFSTQDIKFLDRLGRGDISPPEEPSSTSSDFLRRWSFHQNPISPSDGSGGVKNTKIRSRRPKKQYVCAICGYQSYKSFNMKQHMRTHTDERPFPCDLCSKRFQRRDHRRDHRFTHSVLKPYVCSFCGKGFCQSRTLKNHQKGHETTIKVDDQV